MNRLKCLLILINVPRDPEIVEDLKVIKEKLPNDATGLTLEGFKCSKYDFTCSSDHGFTHKTKHTNLVNTNIPKTLTDVKINLETMLR